MSMPTERLPRDAEHAEHASHAIHPRSYRIAIALVLLLIVYGSLYPLRWDFAHPQDFVTSGGIHLGDVLENVALFLPLGWLLAWHGQHESPGPRRTGARFVLWWLIALVVASVLQWLQKYLPRTPALSDIVFNMLGHTLGWWAGAVSVQGMHRLQQRHTRLHAAERFAMLMVGIWWVAELFPLIPTIDVSSVVDNVKTLWQQPAWQPRRMALHVGMTVLGLEATARLVRSAARVASHAPARRVCALVLAMVLAGKFVVIHQAPGLAVVLGILGGAAVWRGIDAIDAGSAWPENTGLRLVFVWGVALATYLVNALYPIWPMVWRNPPDAMRWMPFGSSLSGNIESAITNVAFECLCFGAMVWTAVRRGSDWRRATLFAALLAFACEWLQRYLPTRTAEITSVVTALGMGWCVAALSRGRQHSSA
jgi:VanZ family protein